jgi:large subunit ribosomal protein L18e
MPAKKGVKTNPEVVVLTSELKRCSRETGSRIWRDISERLSKPKRSWAQVNVGEIDAHVKDGDKVAIPGRLLGSGSISKKITIASVSCTKGAKDKVEKVGGKVVGLLEMASLYPSGSDIRIMK